MKKGVDGREATHVKVSGRIEKIASKWGIKEEGGVAKPSEGGFGVVTESGERVDMWTAQSYLKEHLRPEVSKLATTSSEPSPSISEVTI